jgi:hypothetical protein
MRRVEIIWIDIASRGGWSTPNKVDQFADNDKNNRVTQVGFIYQEDEENVVIVDSYFHDKTLYGTVNKIPRGCIITITDI